MIDQKLRRDSTSFLTRKSLIWCGQSALRITAVHGENAGGSLQNWREACAKRSEIWTRYSPSLWSAKPSCRCVYHGGKFSPTHSASSPRTRLPAKLYCRRVRIKCGQLSTDQVCVATHATRHPMSSRPSPVPSRL